MISNLKSLCDFIWELEKGYGLSDRLINKVPFWNMIRMRLYYDLSKKLTFFSEPHPNKRGWQKKLIFVVGLISSLFKNIFRVPNILFADVLIVEHVRTIEIETGLFADMYSYYYAQRKVRESKQVLVLAGTEDGFNQKNDGLKRLNIDFAEELRSFFGKLFHCFVSLSSSYVNGMLFKEASLGAQAEKEITQTFKKGVVEYCISYCLYRMLFKLTLQAKELVIIDGYSGRAGMIAAAKDSGLMVKELQHGVITRYHLGYSYPDIKQNKRFLPDTLFVWSAFWKKQTEQVWPAELDIYPNHYLENKKTSYAHIERQDDNVIIISQGAISQQLSMVINKNIDKFSECNVFYKLHPSEYGSWQDNKALFELSKRENVEIIKNVDLYQFFSMCKYQVGVFSTALFEGLEFGCELILVDLPGIEYMEDLIESGNAIIFKEFMERNEAS